jgi:hypothetical protein
MRRCNNLIRCPTLPTIKFFISITKYLNLERVSQSLLLGMILLTIITKKLMIMQNNMKD